MSELVAHTKTAAYTQQSHSSTEVSSKFAVRSLHGHTSDRRKREANTHSSSSNSVQSMCTQGLSTVCV